MAVEPDPAFPAAIHQVTMPANFQKSRDCRYILGTTLTQSSSGDATMRPFTHSTLLLYLAFLIAGCGGNENISTETNNPGLQSDGSFVDTDRDGVSDTEEGSGDMDGDGVPNYLDLDSDGDYISDAHEYNHPCADKFAAQKELSGAPDQQREFRELSERVPLIVTEYWYENTATIVRFTSMETEDFCTVVTEPDSSIWTTN